jgi:hypothetical protein
VTDEQRRAAAIEIADFVTQDIVAGLQNAGFKVSEIERKSEGADGIQAIIARHDQPAATDQARAAAEEIDGMVASCDAVLPIIARAIAESERELVVGLRAIVSVLGPGECKAVSCQGCQHEHAEAVAIARALLTKRGRK